ncbi:hypothetical protein BDN72DRAFT_387000 [Pluteus cervinus]|uniref:Uncharacterized protein n=1 Tax=Pluteus cervinus TaxID=181527 RepID=A0ACD3B2J1_9AGAR|nr:hypothetical protein BDN72DRAFT_387000 [Pluteus cervinus]
MELPAELERYIFEWAARVHSGTRAALIQVSKYAGPWIEPILYEIVIVGVRSRGCQPSLDALQRYGHHVRHLLLGTDPKALISQYLVACPRTINLGIWTSQKLDEEAIDALKRLPLERLCIHLEAIFNYQALLLPQAEKILSAFPKLTHLDIASDSAPQPIIPCLKLLPKLSHLSLPRDFRPAPETVLKYWREIPTLEYFTLVAEGNGSEDYSEDFRRSEDDLRVVRCLVRNFLDDWKRAAKGESDMWAYVKVVTERRSGLML